MRKSFVYIDDYTIVNRRYGATFPFAPHPSSQTVIIRSLGGVEATVKVPIDIATDVLKASETPCLDRKVVTRANNWLSDQLHKYPFRKKTYGSYAYLTK